MQLFGRRALPLLLSCLAWAVRGDELAYEPMHVLDGEIRPALEKLVQEGRVPGAAVSVTSGDKIVYMANVGYPDNAIFRLFSLTKPVRFILPPSHSQHIRL